MPTILTCDFPSIMFVLMRVLYLYIGSVVQQLRPVVRPFEDFQVGKDFP